ncbi:MAG: 16S rRNA (uracil(1498)-N(3))-methyltransferase [Magnetospirillum sp. WYHS-4]
MASDTKARLFVSAPLAEGAEIAPAPNQAHYLAHVLRLATGDAVALFNGRDGEWRATAISFGKNKALLRVETQFRPQVSEPDIWLAFAPLKKDRTDFLVEKATELGVARLLPVFTRHTAAGRVNRDRLAAQAVEAAEQCERLSVPDVAEPCSLDRLLESWPPSRLLFVSDETGGGGPLADALAARPDLASWGLLVGPEGGFATMELDGLARYSLVVKIGLGPRILRAETAALAALAIGQAFRGDWTKKPRS